MNILIYASKRNFDAQKAERYFKERGIPFQNVDLKKHKLGRRELELFKNRAKSARSLVSPDAKGARADYVRQLSVESVILDELINNPMLLISPIVRNGNEVTIGFMPEVWEKWAQAKA